MIRYVIWALVGVSILAPAAQAQGGCISARNTACYIEDRFSAEVSWRDSDSNLYSAGRIDSSGLGTVLPINDEINAFQLGDENAAVDVIVRVIDGRRINGNYWVFVGATTSVEMTLTVTDTQTGTTQEYFNPLGNPAAVVTDSLAFPDKRFDGAQPNSPFAAADVVNLRRIDPAAKGVACQSSPTRVCLRENRFAVDAIYVDFQGGNGNLTGAPIGGDKSAAFGVFEDDRAGVLVNVVDGTAINGQFWYVASMITNLEIRVIVTDTETGEIRELINPLGSTSATQYDLGTLGNTINRGHAGFWFNSDTSGQGFSLEFNESLDNFGFLAFYGYEPAAAGAAKLGSSDHRWFTAQGNYSGDTFSMEIFNTTGGAFNDPRMTTTMPVGTAQFVVQDCNTATLAINLPADGIDTQIPLTRLLPQSPGLGDVCAALSLGAQIEFPN